LKKVLLKVNANDLKCYSFCAFREKEKKKKLKKEEVIKAPSLYLISSHSREIPERASRLPSPPL